MMSQKSQNNMLLRHKGFEHYFFNLSVCSIRLKLRRQEWKWKEIPKRLQRWGRETETCAVGQIVQSVVLLSTL